MLKSENGSQGWKPAIANYKPPRCDVNRHFPRVNAYGTNRIASIRGERADRQRDTSLLSVVSVRGVHPTAGTSAMFHRNLREGKNLGSTKKYTKFGQLIITKIIKIIASYKYVLF